MRGGAVEKFATFVGKVANKLEKVQMTACSPQMRAMLAGVQAP